KRQGASPPVTEHCHCGSKFTGRLAPFRWCATNKKTPRSRRGLALFSLGGPDEVWVAKRQEAAGKPFVEGEPSAHRATRRSSCCFAAPTSKTRRGHPIVHRNASGRAQALR